MTETIFGTMFSDVGSNFSGAVSELEYTLQNPSKRKMTNTVIRGFYKDKSIFKNNAEAASSYFQGITISPKYLEKSCSEKLYLELEIEHICPDISKFSENVKNLASKINIPQDSKIGKLFGSSGPDPRTFNIDVAVSFLVGDVYDQDSKKSQIEYSSIEEEANGQFFGISSFKEHLCDFQRKYILRIFFDAATKEIFCQRVSKEKNQDGTPVKSYPLVSLNSSVSPISNSKNKEGDVIIQISYGYIHHELITFLNSNQSKYKPIIEQYSKYFASAGTIVRINSSRSTQVYPPQGVILPIDECRGFKPFDLTYRVPNFLLSGRSQYSVKDVVLNSIKFKDDTGNINTKAVSDLITREKKQTISGRTDYAIKPGERFFVSVDDGKSWTEIKQSNINGRNFTTPEIDLSLSSSRIMFKYVDRYGVSVTCKTTVPYRYQPNSLPHTIEVVSILDDSGEFNTKQKFQKISCVISAPLPEFCAVEGSIDNGKTWVNISETQISKDRKNIEWNGVELAEGINKLCFRTVDLAGNTGANTGIKNVYLKTSLPKNIAKIEPLLYRYGASVNSVVGTSVVKKNYNYFDWYENFYASYKSSTEEQYFQASSKFGKHISRVFNPSNCITLDRTKTEYYPSPSTIWDIPEPERVQYWTNSGSGFRAGKYQTNYKTQSVVFFLEFPLATGERVYGSVDNGRTWVDLTNNSVPFAELKTFIQNFKTLDNKPLVSTTLGYKQVIAYKPYEGEFKAYAEEGEKKYTEGGEYSSIGGSFSPLQNYFESGYSSSGYSFIGGDESEILVGGSRSGRARSDAGTEILKEIEPPKKGSVAVVWNNFDLLEGKSNLLIKIVDHVGNQSVVANQEYYYRKEIEPLTITGVEFVGSVSSENDLYYFENPTHSVVNGAPRAHEAIITFSRNLLDIESVEVFRNNPNAIWDSGSCGFFSKTEKVAPNKVRVAQISIGNESGKTTKDESGKKVPDALYQTEFGVFVGDSCGNVSHIKTMRLQVKTLVTSTASIFSISDDTDIANDFITSNPNQSIEIRVFDYIPSQKRKIYFNINNSPRIDVTSSLTPVANNKYNKIVVNGVVLSIGNNVLTVTFSEVLGDNSAVSEKSFSRDCVLTREDPKKIVIKSSIGEGDQTLRYFICKKVDIPFSYKGQFKQEDKFYGSTDDGANWYQFVPVATGDQTYNFLWKGAPLNDGTSPTHCIRIKVVSGLTGAEFHSIPSSDMNQPKMYYACNALFFYKLAHRDYRNKTKTGGWEYEEAYNATNAPYYSRGSASAPLLSTTQTYIDLRVEGRIPGHENFYIDNFQVRGSKGVSSGTVFINEFTDKPELRVQINFSNEDYFGQSAIKFSGRVKHPTLGSLISIQSLSDDHYFAGVNQINEQLVGYIPEQAGSVGSRLTRTKSIQNCTQYPACSTIFYITDFYAVPTIDTGGLIDLQSLDWSNIKKGKPYM